MGKIRVLLLVVQPLLGESLENILQKLDDVDLIIQPVETDHLFNGWIENKLDIVLVAEEASPYARTSITTRVLEQYPDLPVLRVGLEQNLLRIFTSRTLPARSAELLDILRGLPAHKPSEDQPA